MDKDLIDKISKKDNKEIKKNKNNDPKRKSEKVVKRMSKVGGNVKKPEIKTTRVSTTLFRDVIKQRTKEIAI